MGTAVAAMCVVPCMHSASLWSHPCVSIPRHGLRVNDCIVCFYLFVPRSWFHWTVDEFLAVYNPPNAQAIILERVPSDTESRAGGPTAWIHTKVSGGKGGGS